MISKNLLNEMRELLSVIAAQNKLYQLLICYSDLNIKQPEAKELMDPDSNTKIKNNICIIQKYIYEMNVINKKLMEEFHNTEKKEINKNIDEPKLEDLDNLSNIYQKKFWDNIKI